MGEKVAPPSAELLHVQALREALERGAPPVFLQPAPSIPSNGHGPSDLPGDGLEVQKAYLEQIIENAPEAISIVNPEGRIVRVNHEFSRLFGYAREEATGQTIADLIVPPDRYTETGWISESLDRGLKVSIETRRRRKDGSLVEVQLSAAPVIVEGRKVVSCASYRDITEQKRTEELNAALYNIAARTHSSEEPQQFFAAIHDIVRQLMYARNFYIALYDPET